MELPPMTSSEFQATTGVSDQVVERISVILDLLLVWQQRINLVGKSSLRDPWRRHVLDSAQLMPLAPPAAKTWLDIGSGAGFPGLITAAMGVGTQHLVESSAKKCAFLQEAARLAELDVEIHNARVEDLDPISADVITARAIAPLPKLISHSRPHLAQNGICLFLKSQNIDPELTDAGKYWRLKTHRTESISEPGSCVLRVEVMGDV
jgi:16S rRNA (guanine527-N7)-methyltransferase